MVTGHIDHSEVPFPELHVDGVDQLLQPFVRHVLDEALVQDGLAHSGCFERLVHAPAADVAQVDSIHVCSSFHYMKLSTGVRPERHHQIP